MTDQGAGARGDAGQPIRLFLADVDGSLVTKDKVLTADALAAVVDLGRAGIALAITSGRPPRGMRMLISPLGLTTPIAGFNGGVFVEPDLSVIESHSLDPIVAREALALILDGGLDAWLYTAEEWMVRDEAAPHVAREAWTVKFDPMTVKDFPNEALDAAVKIVGVSDDLEKVAACERDAQEKLKNKASAARSQPYYLDVTHPKANKGQVVAFLSKRLAVPPSQIATIGDMPNDVLMFTASGYSIALGQASDEVKAKATTTTASYEDEGFAKAVAHLLERQARLLEK